MLVVEALSEFVAGFDGRRIAAGTWDKIGDHVIDVIGAAACAQDLASVKAVRAVAGTLFRDGPSLTWFAGTRASPVAAAFANSAAASALDVDDGHRAAIGHPAAPVISAVLAEGEAVEADPLRLASAILLGYEVGIRVAAAQADRLVTRLYSTGRWASLAVAAAVGYLRGFDAPRLAQALAISGAYRPSLIPAGYGLGVGHIKEGIPWAAVTGFAAAELAGQGFLGSKDLLDLAHLFDRGVMLDGLGEGFLLDSAYIKPYSCCRWNHAALDGLLALMDEHSLAPSDIEGIEVATFGAAMRMDNSADPPSVEAAQFSIPFSLAVAAVDGPEALLPIGPQLLGRRDLADFAGRITLRLDEDLDRRFPQQTPARLSLRTRKGAFERFVEHPRGDPANPLSGEEIDAKFRRLCGVGAGRQDRILAAARRLRDDGFAPLLKHLEPGGSIDSRLPGA